MLLLQVKPALRYRQRFQQFLAFRDGARLVHLHPLHHAVAVEHIGGAFVEALLIIEDAVGFAGRAVWPVVRHQRERQAAQLLRPRLQAWQCIGAELQYFNVLLLEFFVVRTELQDLIFSATGESKRHKSHHGLATLETGERHLATGVCVQREIRRGCAYLHGHVELLYGYMKQLLRLTNAALPEMRGPRSTVI